MTLPRYLTLALALVLGSCTFATFQTVQGVGERSAQRREVGPFERVAVEGSFELDLRAGEAATAPEVLVDAHDNLQPYIETRVDGRTLRVSVRDGYRIAPRPRVAIRLQHLSGLQIAGSAQVDATGLSGDSLSIDIAGSGDVRAEGRVDGVEIDIAGSGDVHLTQLLAREVRVRIAGSGDVELHADESLDVRIAGSGDVQYTGEPQISQHVAGSGSIRKAK